MFYIGYLYRVGSAGNRLTVSRNRIVTVASERLTNPTLGQTKKQTHKQQSSFNNLDKLSKFSYCRTSKL